MPDRQTLIRRWVTKLEHRTRARPSVAKWAIRLFRRLLHDGPVSGSDMRSLASATRVPLKFLPRALHVLLRFGLVTMKAASGRIRVQARLPHTLKARNVSNRHRRAVTNRQRLQIHVLDDGRCAVTGKRVSLSKIVLDHIVPFAFGGADDLANLTVISAAANQAKLDGFYSTIRWYRGKRVRGTVGMRWRNGAFWPAINGKLKYQRWA